MKRWRCACGRVKRADVRATWCGDCRTWFEPLWETAHDPRVREHPERPAFVIEVVDRTSSLESLAHAYAVALGERDLN